MGKLERYRELMRARRAGAPLADLVVMKFAMYAGAAPELAQRLRELDESCFEVDLAALRRLPEGTVGRAYARHLDEQGLQPLRVSEAAQRRFADDPLALRYTTTHYLFHVLTGFPTTPAGELGLFAFMIAQGFAGRGRLRLSELVYAVLMPLHALGVRHNVRVGMAMGRAAAPLLLQPMTPLLSQPLAEVRRRLGIPEHADIDPGHPSLLTRWFLPKPAPTPGASA